MDLTSFRTKMVDVKVDEFKRSVMQKADNQNFIITCIFLLQTMI